MVDKLEEVSESRRKISTSSARPSSPAKTVWAGYYDEEIPTIPVSNPKSHVKHDQRQSRNIKDLRNIRLTSHKYQKQP